MHVLLVDLVARTADDLHHHRLVHLVGHHATEEAAAEGVRLVLVLGRRGGRSGRCGFGRGGSGRRLGRGLRFGGGGLGLGRGGRGARGGARLGGCRRSFFLFLRCFGLVGHGLLALCLLRRLRFALGAALGLGFGFLGRGF